MSEFALPNNHHLNLKNILGLDFGTKFIGIAIFCVNRDPYPTPYGRIANTSIESVLEELGKIIEDEFIDQIVIGLPYLTDGQKTSSTARAQEFTKLLSDNFTLPINTQDETLSTFEAESRMKNSPRYNFQVDLKQIDAVAASVILEDFIHREKQKSGL